MGLFSKKRTIRVPRMSEKTMPSMANTLTVGDVERMLLERFPAKDAEPWDRTGLLVGDPNAQVTRVAVALDATVDAIRKAKEAGANLLVCHHPLFIAPPESFVRADSPALASGAGVYAAIESGVSVMSFHTALDASTIAQTMLPGILGLTFAEVLCPLDGRPEKGYGQVCTDTREEALTLGQLATRCQEAFGRPARVWGSPETVLNRVCTFTGSLGDFGANALDAGIDCIVCGEVKYHAALDLSQAGMCILDLGHDVSELPFAGILAEELAACGLPKKDVVVLDQDRNWISSEQA